MVFGSNKAENVVSASAGVVDEFCQSSGLFVAMHEGDLNRVSACGNFQGNLVISPEFKGREINLNDLRHVEGDLIVSNIRNTYIFKAPNLETVAGTVRIEKATDLVKIDMPKLSTVESFELLILPLLDKLILGGGISGAKEVRIVDTSLQSVSGMFTMERIDSFYLRNNRYMTSADLPLKIVKGSIDVTDNSWSMKLSLPKLIQVDNIIIKSVSELNLDSLQIVTRSLELFHNSLTNLSAPELKLIGSTLTINGNEYLSNTYFPKLENIGGALIIVDNDNIKSIDGFNNLQTINGAVNLEGDFDYIQFNELELIKGSTNLRSTSANFDCSSWLNTKSRGLIQGELIKCETGQNINTKALKNMNKVNQIDKANEKDSEKKFTNLRPFTKKNESVKSTHTANSNTAKEVTHSEGLVTFVAFLVFTIPIIALWARF